MNPLDATHDPALRSWVASANDGATDFPVQNLPYARARRGGAPADDAGRIVVAIGDQALDLGRAAAADGVWTPEEAQALAPLARGDLNAFMAAGRPAWRQARAALSRALAEGSPAEAALRPALEPIAGLEFMMACTVGDYTDFYTSIHHATAIGRLFRPDQPLLPNYRWVPIGYHGRCSTLGVSGQRFPRPVGQFRTDPDGPPQFGPCRRLDHELELGVFVGPGNDAGRRVTIDEAEDRLFGVSLLNDWSARDIQAWEYQPLGPFLSKNFATTLSPWIVTMEALAPFRVPFVRGEGEPGPLPYLDGAFNREHGSLDIALEVLLQRPGDGAPLPLSRSNYRDAYWTPAQMVTHHTVGGCAMRPGDLLGSGTLSGPGPGQGGSLLELTQGGKVPVRLPDGDTRTFLQDGDTIVLRGRCEAPGRAGLGFGECRGTVLPALA